MTTKLVCLSSRGELNENCSLLTLVLCLIIELSKHRLYSIRLLDSFQEFALMSFQYMTPLRPNVQGPSHDEGMKSLGGRFFQQALFVDRLTHSQATLQKGFGPIQFQSVHGSRRSAHTCARGRRRSRLIRGLRGQGTDPKQTQGFHDIFPSNFIVQAHTGQGFRQSNQGFQLSNGNGNGGLRGGGRGGIPRPFAPRACGFRGLLLLLLLLSHLIANLHIVTFQHLTGVGRQLRTTSQLAILNVLFEGRHIQFALSRDRHMHGIFGNGFRSGRCQGADHTEKKTINVENQHTHTHQDKTCCKHITREGVYRTYLPVGSLGAVRLCAKTLGGPALPVAAVPLPSAERPPPPRPMAVSLAASMCTPMTC